MKRRRFVQVMTALPAAPALVAQEPVIPPKPTPRTVAEVPKIEATVPDAAAEMVPHFFNPDQFAALRKLSDVLMPALNGTPGALEARAPEFLDFLIGDSPADRQELYRKGLDTLNTHAKKKFAKPFAEVDPAQADEVLAPLREGWTYEPPNDAFARFLQTAKADVMDATVNSREWITVVSKRVRSAGGVGTYWYPIE